MCSRAQLVEATDADDGVESEFALPLSEPSAARTSRRLLSPQLTPRIRGGESSDRRRSAERNGPVGVETIDTARDDVRDDDGSVRLPRLPPRSFDCALESRLAKRRLGSRGSSAGIGGAGGIAAVEGGVGLRSELRLRVRSRLDHRLG